MDITSADPADPDCCAGEPGDLMTLAEATKVADAFKGLADPTRVRILRYLAASPSATVCACHLPTALGIAQPTLSFHLKKLFEAGLLTRERRGRWVHYGIDDAGVGRVADWLTALPAPTVEPLGN